MTKENAKKLLPFIKAYIEGKQIQIFYDNKWHDKDEYSFDSDPSNYRIKPEPKYRPFKSIEECWEEMQKHQPVGWLKSKTILQLNTYEISEYSDWERRFNNYTFADGTPYGIKEE